LFFFLELNEQSTVKDFLDAYRKKEVATPHAYDFFRACYLSTLAEKQREALKILDTEDFVDFEFGEEAFTLALKLSYHLYEDESLELSLDRILKYLKIKSASTEEKEEWKRSRRFIGKLIKLRRQQKLSAPSLFRKRLDKLTHEIHALHEFPLKHWVMDCLKNLK
ncbi:MAG: hypothetical protein AAF696_13640, partial [Bacteroidota bacterium]